MLLHNIPFLLLQIAKKLLSLGASLDLRCKWTDMAAIHYAAYFDVGPVLTVLMTQSKVSSETDNLSGLFSL